MDIRENEVTLRDPVTTGPKSGKTLGDGRGGARNDKPATDAGLRGINGGETARHKTIQSHS